jgi:hypothetical protein
VGEVLTDSVLIAKLCLTSIRAFCYESSDIDVCGATGLSQWRAWTGSNLFLTAVPNPEITMKTLILAAIRSSVIFTAVAVTSLFSVQPAQAYRVTLKEVGSRVVANGSGAFNLTGLTFHQPIQSLLHHLSKSSVDTDGVNRWWVLLRGNDSPQRRILAHQWRNAVNTNQITTPCAFPKVTPASA